METRIDFLQWLETDMSLNILSCLDDPSDLIRASSVSLFWQHFVIASGLCKQLCVRTFPQLASVACIIEPCREVEVSVDFPSGNSVEWETREREHRVYASLFRALTTFPLSYCIADPVCASSTDNYPNESIMNTLDPRDRIFNRGSYWSSKGCIDPEVPATLIYNLSADFCVITDINIQPFQAFFQFGAPIYSSRFVRFRMGYPKSLKDMDHNFMASQECADDKFVWTYTSEQFPMVQENSLQRFKLPEPALCIGGFLQIELLGRIQRQQFDHKYYICVSHLQAIGRPLSPAFDVEISRPSDTVSLKYNAEDFYSTLQGLSDGSLGSSLLPLSPPEVAWLSLEDLIALIHGNGDEPQYEWIDEDDDGVDPLLMF